jgi:DNA-binding NtrC family response regulator
LRFPGFHVIRSNVVPARIVVVHDDSSFLEPLAATLRVRGHEVAAFHDSMLAWDALEAASKIELLITRIEFARGKPHGVALAHRALANRPAVRVLFTESPELQPFAADLGAFLAVPITPAEVVREVNRLLGTTDQDQSPPVI